jgi:hypothetical protein
MIVNCGDYRIKSDKYNWIIEKKHVLGEDSKTPGAISWQADQPAYPNRLSVAFEYIFDRMLKDLGEMPVTEFHTACKMMSGNAYRFNLTRVLPIGTYVVLNGPYDVFGKVHDHGDETIDGKRMHNIRGIGKKLPKGKFAVNIAS